jgi:hypothetical protein
MVCYMTLGPGCKSYRKPGGANEAVIRMLISIGRLVVSKQDHDL